MDLLYKSKDASQNFANHNRDQRAQRGRGGNRRGRNNHNSYNRGKQPKRESPRPFRSALENGHTGRLLEERHYDRPNTPLRRAENLIELWTYPPKGPDRSRMNRKPNERTRQCPVAVGPYSPRSPSPGNELDLSVLKYSHHSPGRQNRMRCVSTQRQDQATSPPRFLMDDINDLLSLDNQQARHEVDRQLNHPQPPPLHSTHDDKPNPFASLPAFDSTKLLQNFQLVPCEQPC